jgi:O-acetyl-ADP-ribose deacetylase (regulator of RNase III)
MGSPCGSNSGLALALHEEWPSLAKDFRHYAHESHPKPGAVWTYPTPDGRRIYNLMTQEGEQQRGGSSSGPATSSNVHHALRALRKAVERDGVRSPALPRLATGAGRLAWEEVRPLIDQHLGDLPIPVYLYTTYYKGQRAKEPGAA